MAEQLTTAPEQRPAAPGSGMVVGVKEFSALVGAGAKVVDSWKIRHDDFPEPRWEVSGNPAYWLPDLLAWRDRHANPAGAASPEERAAAVRLAAEGGLREASAATGHTRAVIGRWAREAGVDLRVAWQARMAGRDGG